MKVCVVQPAYSLNFSESDALFAWELAELDKCDASMDIIVLPEYSNVPCLAKTKAEMEELVDKCTWQWTTQSGVNGYKVTGPNGNSIFLPAAGYCYGSSYDYVGKKGRYWSSTPNESNDDYAYNLYFSRGCHDASWFNRSYGHTVRPVSE